jgi:GNAT superfamily N-acetyltransferase
VLEIRNATVDNIPLIRELTFKIWPQTYASIISKEQIDYMLEMMYSASSLEKQFKEGCRFIIAYDDKDPVAFASFQHVGSDAYKLHKIYVLSSQQGKGTGKFIIDHISDTIKKNNARSLELQVNINNKARQFYEKLGFTEVDRINLDIGNGYFMNDYIMRKIF